MVLDLRFAPLAVVAAALLFSFLVVGGRPAIVALFAAVRSWPGRLAAAVRVRARRGQHRVTASSWSMYDATGCVRRGEVAR